MLRYCSLSLKSSQALNFSILTRNKEKSLYCDYMDKLNLRDLPLKGKRVLMRVDFNVPLTKEGTISDDSRIRAALHSIAYVLEHGASLVLMSHLGKPKGKADAAFSLAPCAKRLSELLEKPVAFAPDCVGPEVGRMVEKLEAGRVLLLENLRFHKGEEKPEEDPAFARALAGWGDVYVNDAFGTAHRAHASTAAVAGFFPGKAAMGFLMEEEIRWLFPLLHNPKRPFFAILGGAKVSTKVGVIESLLKKVDALYLGGGMVYTFLQAKGQKVGESLVEEDKVATAKKLFCEKIRFPLDLVIADGGTNEAKKKVIAISDAIPDGWRGMDIGPKTVGQWGKELSQAATVFWNGPLGVFEMPSFAAGTRGIAESLARAPGKVIVGGGDSVAAIEQMGFGQSFAHLSTGGGASLEYLEFGHLPGIDALSNKPAN